MLSKKLSSMLIAILILILLPTTVLAASNSASGSNKTDSMIYDYSEAYSEITISGEPWNNDAVIDSIDVSFNIDHDNTRQLEIWLASADWNSVDGEGVYLARNPAPTGDDWIDGYGETVDMDVTLNPTSNWFHESQEVNQTWLLAVRDTAGGDEGRIDSWSITIHYHYPVQPYIEVDNASVNTSSNSSINITGELRHPDGDPNGKTVYGEIIIPGSPDIDLGSDVTYSSFGNNGLFEFNLSPLDFYSLCEGNYSIHVWFDGDQDYYPADGYGNLSVNDDTEPNRPRNVDDGVDGYSSDNTPRFSWDPPDDRCGILRYWYSTTDSTPDSNDSSTNDTFITLSSQTDGLHYFYVAAEDYQGNIGLPASHAFHIDTSPSSPPGNVDDGVSGWNNDATPTFTWTVPIDVSSISGYYWSTTDSTPDENDNWLQYATTTQVTLPTQSSGTHTFYITAKNGAGLISDPASHTFSVDVTGPQGLGQPDLYSGDDSGQSPTDNITNDESIRFDWGAANDTHSGLSGYYWSLDDSSPTSGGTFTQSASASNINPGEGEHKFYVQARDNVGNVGDVSSLQFTVDRNPLSPPEFDWPGEDERITDTTPELRWNAIPDAWKYQVYVREDAANPSDSRTSPELVSTTSWQIPSNEELGFKNWGWQVRAWDIAGNPGEYGRNGTIGSWGHFTVKEAIPDIDVKPDSLSFTRYKSSTISSSTEIEIPKYVREVSLTNLSNLLEGEDWIRVIVSLRDPLSLESPIEQRKLLTAQLQDRVLKQLTNEDFQLIRKYSIMPGFSGLVSKSGLDKLSSNPDVLLVSEDKQIHLLLNESVPLINADDVQSLGFTGDGVNIAVLDTGIDPDHPDLNNDLVAEHCFTTGACPPHNSFEGTSAEDGHGHGTAVSGIITSDGTIAPLGVAPDAGIVAVKVMNDSGRGFVSDWENGISWVIENHATLNISIINMSLSTDDLYSGVCDSAEFDLSRLLNLAVANNISVFAASGNNGSSSQMAAPACISNVISVGAVYDDDLGSVTWEVCRDPTTAADQISCYSNSNNLLDVLAPSYQNLTTGLNGGLDDKFSGTSAASPHAAATAALILEANPGLEPALIETILENSGVMIHDERNGLSFPRIDALAAIQEGGLTISNKGNGDLEIYSISVVNSSCWLTVPPLSAQSSIINPAASVFVEINVSEKCVTEGVYQDTIRIRSNDQDENPFDVPVTLEVIHRFQPDLVVSEPQFSVSPPFFVGQSVDWSVIVTNKGDGDALGTHVGYYIGNSCTDLSNLETTDQINPLAPSASEKAHDAFPFEADDLGIRYLIAYADYRDDEPNEKIESNNTSCYGPFDVFAAPELTWVGDTNYEGDGLHPESGSTADAYNYRIRYTDADGEAPNYVQLHIRKSGADISGSPFTMSCEGGDYMAGVICSYNKAGLEAGADYTYYFEAENVKGGPATPTSELDAPDVTEPVNIAIVHAESGIVNPGESINIPVGALNLSDSGLGDATIEILYDDTVLNASDCIADPNSHFESANCDPNVVPGTVACTVTSSTGVLGDALLCVITFDAIGSPGDSSTVNLMVQTFADPNGIDLPVIDEDGLVTIAEGEYIVNVTVEGNGSVTNTPGNPYRYNEVAKLEPVADPGWYFAGWSGANAGDLVDNGDGTWSLTMDGDKAVTAAFIEENEVTVTVVGNGVVNNTPGNPYRYNEMATLEPVADPGWYFAGWSGANAGDLVDNADGTWSITMDGNKAVTATFLPEEYDVTVIIEGNGSVNNTPGNPYHYGDVATLKPIPDPGWYFYGWSGPDPDGPVDNGDGTWSIIVDGDKALTATFLPEEYDVTVTIEGNGSVNNVPGNPYRYNEIAKLEPVNDPGWYLDGWSGANAGELVDNGDGTWSLTMDGDKAVTATFLQEFEVTVTVLGNGVVNNTPGNPYHYNEVAKLEPLADPGWYLDGWSGANAGELVDNGDGTWSLTMDWNKAVTATFLPEEYDVTMTVVGNGVVNMSPGNPFRYNEVGKLEPVADPGWYFDGWSGANADELVDNGDGTWSLTMDGNKAVTANFVEVLEVDLAATKAINPESVSPGKPFTYQISVTNNGPASATNVIITDKLPDGLEFVSFVPKPVPGPTTCDVSGNMITCKIDELPAGNSVEGVLKVSVQPSAHGELVNTLCVASDQLDSIDHNNCDDEPIVISSISGQITDQDGSPIPNVDISIGSLYNLITDFNGEYSIAGLVPWEYTVTPEKAGFAFTQPSETVTVPPDSPELNFTGSSEGSVMLKVSPLVTNTYIDHQFDVEILVQAGEQTVDGAAAYLGFDPALLQVVSITPGTTFPLTIQNRFDNLAGTIDYAAGTFADFPSGTFTLATVTFETVEKSEGTRLIFNLSRPRMSDVTFGGRSVMDGVQDGAVIISDKADLIGTVILQGRPDVPDPSWSIPLTVKFTLEGEASPTYTFTPTTDEYGEFTIDGITPGTYTVHVKNSHTLQNTQVVALTPGINTLEFGTLREGDANDDNFVTLLDFSILVTTFGLVEGDPGFDGRADFNEDGFVTLLDFSLLATNFGQGGDTQTLSASILSQPEFTTDDVTISVEPGVNNVSVGEKFTVQIQLHTGSQLVDGGQASLNFDPGVLRVVQISGNSSAFPLELLNQYDNNNGTLDYSSGTLSNFPSGDITLVEVEFEAVANALSTSLEFNLSQPRKTDVTYGGQSLLTETSDGDVNVSGGFKISLPLMFQEFYNKK